MGSKSKEEDPDVLKWKTMFGHLADQITKDTNADMKKILQDLPSINLTPLLTNTDVDIGITTDTARSDDTEVGLVRINHCNTSEFEKLQFSNATLKEELESAKNQLQQQSETNRILSGRLSELESQQRSAENYYDEKLSKIRVEIQAELLQQYEEQIYNLSKLVQYLSEWNPKLSDQDLNTLFVSTVAFQAVSIFETSTKKLRTCPELVQQAANENKMARADSTICFPILEAGDSVRNVLYIEGVSTSAQLHSARLTADVLRLRLINLNLKDMATANSERCEALLNMITIVGNIESERARNPSVLCWAQSQLQAVLKCQLCRIWLVSDDNTTDLVSFSGNPIVEHRKPLGLGILSSVHISKQHVLHNDAIIQHPKFHASIDVPEDFNYGNCSSLLCVPVVDTGPDSELGDLHGVVQFLGRIDGQQFSNADLEIAKIFCRRLCSALRRERRVQHRFEEVEKDLLNASQDRDRYQAHLTGFEIITNLFNRDQGELYPSNFSTKVTGALRDALNAELVAIASVMPGHLLPYRLERVDKISHSPAFKRLAKQAIDSRSVVIRDNIHVSKVSYPLLIACTPLLDNFGRVIAVVFVGIQTSKFASHFSVILSIFANLCGTFLDRKHNLLKFSATMRFHTVDDEPAVSNSNDIKAPLSMENCSKPTNFRANSSIVLSDDEFRFSRSSSITNDDAIEATMLEPFSTKMQSELSVTSPAPVSAWRDWLTNELGSDTDQDEAVTSTARSTRAEARIKSFALLHAESMSNLFDNMPSKATDSDVLESIRQQSSINTVVKAQRLPSPKPKPSPSSKRPSIPHLSLSTKGREIEEINEVMAALIFETDDSADTIEFTGGEIEYIHPKTDSNSMTPEIVAPPRSRRHERVVSSIDLKNVNLQTIFGHSENISDIAEETMSHFSQDSNESRPERSSTHHVATISIIDQGQGLSRAPSVSSAVSSYRSSRAGSRRHTRKKIFQSESDIGVCSESATSRSSTSRFGPVALDDPIMSLTSLSSDEFLQIKAENDNMLRVLNVLCSRTDMINPVDENAAIRSIAEGALIALSVIVTQSDMLQIRIGKYWYRWQPENENISDPSFVSYYCMSPGDLSEELNAAENPSWKGTLCVSITNGKAFSRTEFWGVKAVATRLNQILAYHCKFTELIQKGQSEYRELARLQNQLQMSNALNECARTLTLSRGLHQIFGPDSCPLTRLMNAESAQLWLLDQTCTYLWTVFSESGSSNSSLKTIRCPIDQVCLLTQVAVSRMSAIYYDEDIPAAYNEEYDGIISTQKPGLRPRSLLMSAIGSDREGVLGVVRVCNKCEPTSNGNRVRFTSSDQKFLETICDIALDTVRSFRNSQKLQDRLEPAIKLAQSERQSRQRMQVLLSAQVSRLSKISKQALDLGEVASLATKFLDRIWKIPLDNSSISIPKRLTEACFTFWKSLSAIDQFFIFVTDSIATNTNLPSVSMISSLGNELSEFIEHSLSSKEVTETRVPPSDFRQIHQLLNVIQVPDKIESNEERWVCAIPIQDLADDCVAICLCSKPPGPDQKTDERHVMIDHDQAQLFISILGFYLHHLSEVCSCTQQIHNQNNEIHSLNGHLELANASLSSYHYLVRFICDTLQGSLNSRKTVLRQIRQLLSSELIRVIAKHEIDERLATICPDDEHMQISLESVFGENLPEDLFKMDNEITMKFIWRSCCINDQYFLVFGSTESTNSQIEYYDYTSRSAVAAYLLRQDYDQKCQKMEICSKELQDYRKKDQHLSQIMSLMRLFESDRFLGAVSKTELLERDDKVDMSEELEIIMKEMAEILECDFGTFIDLIPDQKLAWREQRLQDTDLYEFIRSLSGAVCSHQTSNNVFLMIINGLHSLGIVTDPDRYKVKDSDYVLIPLPLYDIRRVLILISVSPSNITQIHRVHEQFFNILSRIASSISRLNQNIHQQSEVELYLRKQNDDGEQIRVELQTQLDHCLSLVEASARDFWPMLSVLQCSTQHSSPGLDMILEDIFQHVRITYDHISIMIRSGSWARPTTLNDLTSGLHPDLKAQAERALNDQQLITATAPNIGNEYRVLNSPSGQMSSSISALWIPIANTILIQILRRGSTFNELDLISARLYSNIINSIITRRMLSDQVQQADVRMAKLQKQISESELRQAAMKSLLKELLSCDLCLFDLSTEQLVNLQSIVREIMDADQVTIYSLYQSDILRYAAHEKAFQQRQLVGTHNIITWVLSMKSPYNVINSDTDPRYNHVCDGPVDLPQHTDAHAPKTASSILYVPMNDSHSEHPTIALLQLVRFGIEHPFLPEHCQTADIISNLFINLLSANRTNPAVSSDVYRPVSDSNRSLELQFLAKCGLWRLDRSDRFIQIGRDVISMLQGRFSFSGAALFILDDKDQRYHLQYTDMVLTGATNYDDVKFSVRQGLLGSAAASASIQIISFANMDERYEQFPDQWMSDILQSTVIQPIIDPGSCLVSGLLQIVNMKTDQKEQTYTDLAQYLSSVSALISVILQSHRLGLKWEKELSEKLESAESTLSQSKLQEQTYLSNISVLDKILEFSTAISGAVRLASIFQSVQTLIRSCFQADRAHMLLYDSEKRDLFTNIYDLDTADTYRCIRLSCERSVAGIAQRLGRPVLVNRPWTESGLSSHDTDKIIDCLQSQSWYITLKAISEIIAAPVYDQELRVVAVIEICLCDTSGSHHNSNRWTTDHLNRITQICRHISLSLQNCKQFHQLRRQYLKALERDRRSLPNLASDDIDQDRLERSRVAAPQDREHVIQLQNELQQVNAERQRLQLELSKLHATLSERNDAIETSRKRIQGLEHSLQYTQMQFRKMLIEPIDDDHEHNQKCLRDLNELQQELNQARNDNLQLMNAMQSLISEYAADGNERIRQAIYRARQVLSLQRQNK